ncbi:MAG: hypothetical protein K6C99_09580 [Lachnospiraceae bacterium]|nr:hypothetical protein [Lachnospiraceae bacterium]
MIDFKDNLYKVTLDYIKKEKYSGSCDGKRFMITMKVEKGPDDTETKLINVCMWPEPYSLAKTDDDKKSNVTFPFDNDGLAEAWKFIETCCTGSVGATENIQA